ncbi:glutamate 5-kinase [Pampinifervens florentissimum]|uniref:glutamate 5-kinase n=1 Tax=Pampinifervens florentissimum TaxID=1632019 RepID=UPI0013B488A0|nr:glutamate 5-kinase [Hydrogenobacter sp. T-8]QID33814.1 glutamate 5-kinase [Hydrogenobacter sp. T-8]
MVLLVKIGSNLIQTQEGDIDLSFLSRLARDIKKLRDMGHKTLIVSSGAVLCGVKKLNLSHRPTDLRTKQAVAGVGQAYLMHLYDMVFSNYGLTVGQALLTADIFKDKEKFENAKNALSSMLSLGIVPVINENDTVAISELLFGDNDFLAIHTAYMMKADLIVIFSTAGGLLDHEGRVVPVVEDVDKVLHLVKGVNSQFGTGGMLSKITASRIAVRLGIPVVITGKEDSLLDILEGRTTGTYFKPSEKPLKEGKKALAMLEEPKGAIYIDEGAYRAIKQGKSLLPAGIKKVEGSFQRGDVVVLYDERGFLVGKGKVNFSSEEVRKIIGKKGKEVKDLLKTSIEEVVHTDRLVIF